MNLNIIRVLVVALLSVLIPNIAGAYYSDLVGRFTSRDPYGDIVRMGTETQPVVGAEVGFIARDTFDPTETYHDGTNLYQYVQSHPTASVDPTGLMVRMCGGTVYDPGVYGCCNDKRFDLENGKKCCINNVVGPCGPPGPSCADEGDWLDCMACCLNAGGMDLGVHGGVGALGARVPKVIVLPGQASTTSVYTKACQRFRLGKNAVRSARFIGRVGIVGWLVDGAYSWGLTASCAAGCSGSN